MIKQICILTKSYKHGGYCVAGIDVNNNEWIRLVNSDNPANDEIRKEQMFLNGKPIECLDVIEYDFVKNIPNSCQTENWLLNTSVKPKFIKSISLEELANIIHIENDDYFIINDSNLLYENQISNTNRSLFVFSIKNLTIEATTYESFGEIKFKYKCMFDYKNIKYRNISLTDPLYRDVALDGVNISNALVIASLPCVPYSDDLYYKFVAKIIPIDSQLAEYIERKGDVSDVKISSDNISTTQSPFVKFDLVVQAQQTPGVVLFNNYDQLKNSIANGVSYYSEFNYTLDNYQLALKHHNELKYVKNILEKTKRDIVKSYNAPLEVVEKRIDELIDLIKVPFKKIDAFIKQNEKNSKKYDIYIYSKELAVSLGLQEHMDNIFRSAAYFEEKWLNASCSKSVWKSAIATKLKTAVKDIEYILSLQNDNKASILAHYYQTLSMEKVQKFIDSFNRVVNDGIINDSKPIPEPTSTQTSIPPQQSNVSPISNPANIDNDPIVMTSPTNLTDSEILKCVAKSVNPYTGEIITGIDDLLKSRLEEVAIRINAERQSNHNKGEHQVVNIKKYNTNGLALALRNFAEEVGFKEGIVFWKILRKKAIDDICKKLPLTIEDFYNKRVIISSQKISKYGESILKIIHKYLENDGNILGDSSNIANQENSSELRVGEKWRIEEDEKLIEEFKSGLTIRQIAEIHNRKPGGIRARLKKHNLIE